MILFSMEENPYKSPEETGLPRPRCRRAMAGCAWLGNIRADRWFRGDWPDRWVSDLLFDARLLVAIRRLRAAFFLRCYNGRHAIHHPPFALVHSAGRRWLLVVDAVE